MEKIADICLILGGPQLLSVMQEEFGCCSKREVDRLIERPRFVVSPAVPTRSELQTNYRNFHGRRPHPRRSMQTLMIDGVNGEYDPVQQTLCSWGSDGSLTFLRCRRSRSHLTLS